MKAFKLFILWLVVTIAMVVTWAAGTLIGNAITSSSPPPPPDAAHAGLIFLAVCAINSILIVMLLRATGGYTGMRRSIALVSYVFVIQSLLPQMETFFFASGIGISNAQVTAILIAGIIVCVATIAIALVTYNKLKISAKGEKQLVIQIGNQRTFLLSLAVLIVVVYPFLYLTFGYYIAWQNESLRIYYTNSPEMASYTDQLASVFGDGIYFFQILRGLIWAVVTAPVAIMLSENRMTQFLLIGIVSSLLPSVLLFIPNPYMPAEIAITHFVETSTSNFLWGLVMVWFVRRNMR